MKKSGFRKMLKIGAILLGSFVGLLILASLLFYVYRDTIGREILLRVNNHQKGKVSFSDVALTPFVHFPSISLRLSNIVYTHEFLRDTVSGKDTIASIGKLYVSIDITDLIAGDVNVSKLTLADGTVFLKMYPDSSLNIIEAISSPKPELIHHDSLNRVTKSDTLTETDLRILLESIHLKNVHVLYHSFAKKDTLQVEIMSIKASLDYQDRIVKGNLLVNSKINDFNLFKDKSLNDLELSLNTSFSYDENLKKASIGHGDFQIAKANFSVEGYTTFLDHPEIDISLSGHDEDLSFFGFWLSETGLNNMKSGSSYFTGTIKGSIKDKLPAMNFDFGMKNVNLHLPSVNREISDLNFEGTFISGIKPDFSKASVVVKKLSGKMPGGFLNAKLEVNDFTRPEIKLLFDMEADIAGFDEVFNINGIQSLNGRVSMHTVFEGKYDIPSGTLLEDIGESLLILDSVNIEVPGLMNFGNICGEIDRTMDTLLIDSLSLFAGNSDFFIEGEIKNWLTIFENTEKEILADLHIVSDTFDLPVFCSFDPNVGKNFPYQIIDIDLNVLARTTTDKLLDFYSNPEIDFSINSLDATIYNLFPPVFIDKGTMYMTEKEKRVHLNFEDFELEIADSEILAHVLYASPPLDPDFVGVDATISGLNPSLILFEKNDSIPGFANGILNGNIKTEIEMGVDTNVFESLTLISSWLDYTTEKDTFDITALNLEGKQIHYSGKETPFASMTADIDLRLSEIKSNHFYVNDIAFDIQAHQGIYTVNPEQMQFFGKEGQGVYVLKPFEENPTYALKYKITNFRIENFLSNLMADTLLKGNMNLDLDVVLTGYNDERPLKGINGFVNMEGDNLTLHGIDLDNIIKKFQRSQNFNLVDVGAVMLAGPFGLAITKGSEFANLAFGDYGDITQVRELDSEWDCVNGKLIMTDVAFATDENRVACKGWIDLPSDSLNITIAVLDKNGCSILSQSVYGSLDDPQYSELKIVSTIIAPITNLLDGALGKDCELFYDGKIKHPVKKKKNE